MTTAAVKDQFNGVGAPVLEGLEAVTAGTHSIDISEEFLASRATGLLATLLLDRSTGKNILWATDHYEHLGDAYAPEQEITIESITSEQRCLIQPRVVKSKAQQWDRTKGRAEVFTPSWLCNQQNNHIDEAWFGRPNVFNTPVGQSWIANPGPINFDGGSRRAWKDYVDDRRLEVACGEGPYLVSRYDAATGEPIDLDRRIGMLDRKLRIVTENTRNANDWRKWARRAVESIYGFEYQGDSLLLARQNILVTYEDYAVSALGVVPDPAELLSIATVISWNIWQMDLFTGRPPLKDGTFDENQLELFSGQCEGAVHSCRIFDWRAKQKHYLRLQVPRGGAL